MYFIKFRIYKKKLLDTIEFSPKNNSFLNYGVNNYLCLLMWIRILDSESEFNEFEPRLKSAKNRFQLSAGLNLETLNTILSGTNHV